MGTSPSREESSDSTNARLDENEKATGTLAVKRERGLGTDCIQATVAANGGRAGDGPISDAFRMAVDQ